MDLLDLSKHAEAAIKKIEFDVNEFTKLFVATLIAELTTVTPVDTSKAISNWQANLRFPVTGKDIPAHYRGVEGSTQPQSASAAFEIAKAILSVRKIGDVVFISNLAKYIVFLNEGSSYQAPSGFIETAIDKVEAMFEGALKIEVF